MTKIAKNGPYLAGVSGVWVYGLGFLDWFRSGMPEKKKPPMGEKDTASFGHIFCPDGLIISLSDIGWSKKRPPAEAPFYAFGSGQDYCYGAMSMGATAEEAVRAALIHETCSGSPIDVLSHHPIVSPFPANAPFMGGWI